MKLLAPLMLSLAFIVGCNGKSDWEKEVERQVNNINTLRDAITVEYGAAVYTKKTTVGGETYVVYQISATGEYLAFNLDKWDGATMTAVSQYVNDGNDIVRNLEQRSEWTTSGYYRDIEEYQWVTSGEWVTEYQKVEESRYDSSCSCYVTSTYDRPFTVWKDTSGYDYVKIGEEWVDTSGYKNYYYGSGFRFNNANGLSRDLDTYAAVRESMTVENYAKRLKSAYSLSNDRAKELANLSYKHQRLENQRALTPAEKDVFAIKALGVSMKEVESTLKRRAAGDERSYKDLLRIAAKVNRTSPEMIGQFFEDMLE